MMVLCQQSEFIRVTNRGYVIRCACGWASPVVCDKRTVDQAWVAHAYRGAGR